MGKSNQSISNLAILDCTVLTNLALVKRPDLVLNLWRGRACTTLDALTEYLAADAERDLPQDCWNSLPVLEMNQQEKELAYQLPHRFGIGERACLAVVMTRGGLLVTDDLDARRVARSNGMLLSGTLGILIESVKQELLALDEANHLLARMIAAGYRSPLSELKP